MSSWSHTVLLVMGDLRHYTLQAEAKMLLVPLEILSMLLHHWNFPSLLHGKPVDLPYGLWR